MTDYVQLEVFTPSLSISVFSSTVVTDSIPRASKKSSKLIRRVVRLFLPVIISTPMVAGTYIPIYSGRSPPLEVILG